MGTPLKQGSSFPPKEEFLFSPEEVKETLIFKGKLPGPEENTTNIIFSLKVKETKVTK